MTALPRFLSAKPASSIEVLLILSFLLAQLITATLGWWIAAELCYIGLLFCLIAFALRCLRSRTNTASLPPPEFVWIPAALLHGLLGTVLLIAGQAGWNSSWTLSIGRVMFQQGFVLCIVTGIGGFMAPRLMGRSISISGMADVQERLRLYKKRIINNVIGIGVFFSSFLLEASGNISLAYCLRAMVVTWVFFIVGKNMRLPKATELYVRYLWIAVYMMPIGLWLAGFFPLYRVAFLHLTFLGGLSLMVISVATMVIYSHSGKSEQLKRQWWVLILFGICMVVALFVRLSADFIPEIFFMLIGISSLVWISGILMWLMGVFPLLFIKPVSGEFERMHKLAKDRLRS